MFTHNYILEPDDWESCIPIRIVSAVLCYRDALNREVRWLEKNGARFRVVMRSFDFFRLVRLEMPRKGNSNGRVKGLDGKRDIPQSGGGGWRWINIRLTDEDIAVLSNADDTLEYLAASVLALAMEGVNITVKSMDGGETICCTLNRPDSDNRGGVSGISSFSGTVRDALLVSLYKYERLLGGEWDNIAHFAETMGSRPRFR